MDNLVACSAKPSYLAQTLFVIPTFLECPLMHRFRHQMMLGELESVALTQVAAAIVLGCCFDIVVDHRKK